jgi:hypothetical protein
MVEKYCLLVPWAAIATKIMNLTGVTPYGTNGLFMATLALNSEINECIDADKDGFGVNCVWGNDCNDSDYHINPT